MISSASALGDTSSVHAQLRPVVIAVVLAKLVVAGILLASVTMTSPLPPSEQAEIADLN